MTKSGLPFQTSKLTNTANQLKIKHIKQTFYNSNLKTRKQWWCGPSTSFIDNSYQRCC